MNVAALDLSLTCTGWARTRPVSFDHPKGWERGTIKPRSRGVVRLQAVLNGVVKVIDGADLVIVEGYSFSSRQSHAHGLGELGGVIRLALHQHDIPFVEVPPATLKKFATGRGNAPKQEVLVEAVKRLGYQGSDHNEADSLWLLQIAMNHLSLPGAIDVPKSHSVALEKIQWPSLTSAT